MVHIYNIIYIYIEWNKVDSACYSLKNSMGLFGEYNGMLDTQLGR